MRSTYIAKPGEVERKWWVVDATGQSLGRLASEVHGPSVDTVLQALRGLGE